ncbi:conserved hypothetical protein [Rhodococcus sp. RD6.2]|uniref:YqgE/AlgH family protein n=1 Tax=unclassified Rhodococcus (in: high G+C Gram-positive bacteria) TaxID=192944 RepID=UPI00063B941B|nr:MULTISPECIES: YqgE/AlgH family protein [unclassified Rhodococcus (in: high G+C Gram-positive bacteria)]CRK53809.1 conserved hypothetical protein [Rhodococcus sp. RD6.2]
MESADEPDDRTASTERAVRPGSLLVSATGMTDPSFRRTVVYVIEHNDGGSLGVVLNRASETAVHTVLPQWAPLCARPQALYIGGPVKLDSALCLATVKTGARIDGVPGLRRVDGRVVMVDLDSDPEQVGPHLEGVRVFAGYSGWTLGQLDGELQRDDWIVLSALPSDVIGSPRSDLWAQVLRRQPLPLSLLATHPLDVDRN